MNIPSLVLQTSYIGSFMEEIFIGEAIRICKVDIRTFNKWVDDGVIRPIRTIPPRFRVFSKEQVLKLAKKIPKERKKGLPILMKKSPKK